MAIKDVHVEINVRHPASVVGLGRPLILVAGTTVGYKEYKSLESLVTDHGKTTEAYKLAETIMKQKNKPNMICVATYVKGTDLEPAAEGTTLEDVIKKFYDKSWHFAMLAESDAAERLMLSNTVQPYKFKFAVVLVKDATELSAFAKNNRTIPLIHKNDGERLDGALIGDAANITVGEITWKFRHNLVGITPSDFSDTEVDAIDEAGGNAYVMVAGEPQMTNGQVATREFIDQLHGDDWIKATMEKKIQDMLRANPKVEAGPQGTSLISGVMTSVLTTAGSQGIIAKDEKGQLLFNVFTAPYSEGTEDEKKNRVYSGATFDYIRQDAIHKVNVNGAVVSE